MKNPPQAGTGSYRLAAPQGGTYNAFMAIML
jgi:hypothetical protein